MFLLRNQNAKSATHIHWIALVLCQLAIRFNELSSSGTILGPFLANSSLLQRK